MARQRRLRSATPPSLIRASRAHFVFPCMATLALALAACGGASNAGSSTGARRPAIHKSTVTKTATTDCAATPHASPVATVQWNPQVKGSPTIKAGQAVAFVTQNYGGPTVTEGKNGTAVAHPCTDATLQYRSPLILTFPKPGVYHIFCRKAPTTMFTVVRVV